MQLAALSQAFASLTGLYLEKPRQAQPIHEYTRRFWPSHIRPIFLSEWEEKCLRIEEEGKERPTKVPVEARNAVIRRCWAQESSELQAEIQADVEAEHREEMKKYHEKMNDLPNIGKMYTW